MTSSDTTSPILITGATGRHGGTGAHLVRRLREAGRSVRALVRRLDERTAPLQALGAEIVMADLHDRASLVPALEGVGLAYFTYPVNGGIVQAAANFAAAARQVGGHPRVVVMSNGASRPESPSHFGRAHWLAEEVLGWAGLDLVILRIASFFYENVPTAHGRSIRDEGMIRNCFGDARLTWISGEDAAEIALVALLHPERFERGMVQYPPGAELLSHAEIARVLSEELSRPIRFEPITREAWRDELLALAEAQPGGAVKDRKSTRLNSSHTVISYAVFCLNVTTLTALYTLSLHDALPISRAFRARHGPVSARRRAAQPRRDRARAERGALAANPLRAHHARGLAGRAAGAR